MRIPRLKLSVRTMMIAVAIAAVAPVAAVQVYDVLERRAKYLGEAETCARSAALERALIDQHDRLIAAFNAQIEANKPPAPGSPFDTNDWRRSRVESSIATLEQHRSMLASLTERERKFRRAAATPWRPIEDDR